MVVKPYIQFVEENILELGLDNNDELLEEEDHIEEEEVFQFEAQEMNHMEEEYLQFLLLLLLEELPLNSCSLIFCD
jgi:hypothetical protein